MNMDKKPDLVDIRLFTKQQKYAVPNRRLTASILATPKDLAEVVNGLLKLFKSDRLKFHFFINNELLVSSLRELMSSQKLSNEHELRIEFVEATPSPKPENCIMHDDWVSSVHVSDKWIVTGCYDHSVYIWTIKGDRVISSKGHYGAVKGISWIRITDREATFVSGSQDQTAIVWALDFERKVMYQLAIFCGHARSIDCLNVNPSTEQCATGGWDNTIKIWSTDPAHGQVEERAIKRFKVVAEGDSDKIRLPLATIEAHKECVSSLQWIGDDLLSSSWDHTLKIWDVENGATKSEFIGSKAFFCAHYSYLNRLIIAGGPDRRIQLYDHRTSGDSIVKKMYSSHSEWVQSLKWSPVHPFLFVSGGYDKHIKLWDIRSENTPLYDMEGHDDKILCLDWSNPNLIASGACDNTLRTFNTRDICTAVERHAEYYQSTDLL